MMEFVSKDNLHTATDKNKIRRLMVNAERLGELGVVEKCSQRLEQLKDSSQQKELKMNSAVSKIDLTYWMDKNTHYGDVPLNKSMRTAQTNLKNYNISYDFETCNQLIDQIHADIAEYHLTKKDNLAIRIFDIIQLWGGGMGIKRFYFSGTRHDLPKWLPNYISFIKVVSEEDNEQSIKVQVGLEKLLSIYGLGMSFASKHLKFWNNLPIFDDRISLLLYSSKAKKISAYLKFLDDVSNLASQSGLTILEVETSLFAFSQHYFKNDKLLLTGKNTNDVDYDIAREIAEV
ncbi:hypothetical protein N9Q35_00925 [Amylibacter sp.]|nr:hypothetical protein [Amylibacter sp.]